MRPEQFQMNERKSVSLSVYLDKWQQVLDFHVS